MVQNQREKLCYAASPIQWISYPHGSFLVVDVCFFLNKISNSLNSYGFFSKVFLTRIVVNKNYVLSLAIFKRD